MSDFLDHEGRQVGEGAGTRATEDLPFGDVIRSFEAAARLDEAMANRRMTEDLRAPEMQESLDWKKSAITALGLWLQAREQIGGAEIGDGPLQWAGRVRAIIERYRRQSNENWDSLQSVERLYARALDRIGTLEATLTAAQARNGELMEKNRKLAAEVDQWKPGWAD
jgi:hypothetical protein